MFIGGKGLRNLATRNIFVAYSLGEMHLLMVREINIVSPSPSASNLANQPPTNKTKRRNFMIKANNLLTWGGRSLSLRQTHNLTRSTSKGVA